MMVCVGYISRRIPICFKDLKPWHTIDSFMFKAKMTVALEFLVDLHSIHQCCFFPYFPYESCVVLSPFMALE